MKLYFAGLVESSKETREFAFENIPDLHVLISYFYTKAKKAIERGFKHIFLDCGAYSAHTKGVTIDLKEYTEYCQNLPKEVEVIAALDVISDDWASLHNWEYMKERGVDAIPTYHFGGDPEVLDYYAKHTDYIALGGTVGRPREHVADFSNRIFAKYPTHRFHAFGVSSIRLLKELPFHSADATTWNVGSRFGEIILESGQRFKAGDKFLSENSRIQNELINNFGINAADPAFHTSLLDQQNILTLHHLLVIKHNKKDFTGRLQQSSLF